MTFFQRVQLVELIAVHVFLNDEHIGFLRIPGGQCDRVRLKGQLSAVGIRELHLVNLRRVAETSTDQHRMVCDIPTAEYRSPIFQIGSRPSSQRYGNGWDAVCCQSSRSVDIAR